MKLEGSKPQLQSPRLSRCCNLESLEGKGHLGLHKDSEASLGYLRPVSQTNKQASKKMSTYNKGGQPAQIDQKRQIPLLGTSEHSPAQAAAIKSLSMESPLEIKGACMPVRV